MFVLAALNDNDALYFLMGWQSPCLDILNSTDSAISFSIIPLSKYMLKSKSSEYIFHLDQGCLDQTTQTQWDKITRQIFGTRVCAFFSIFNPLTRKGLQLRRLIIYIYYNQASQYLIWSRYTKYNSVILTRFGLI